jgi:ATP/ADP translocase
MLIILIVIVIAVVFIVVWLGWIERDARKLDRLYEEEIRRINKERRQ